MVVCVDVSHIYISMHVYKIDSIVIEVYIHLFVALLIIAQRENTPNVHMIKRQNILYPFIHP